MVTRARDRHESSKETRAAGKRSHPKRQNFMNIYICISLLRKGTAEDGRFEKRRARDPISCENNTLVTVLSSPLEEYGRPVKSTKTALSIDRQFHSQCLAWWSSGARSIVSNPCVACDVKEVHLWGRLWSYNNCVLSLSSVSGSRGLQRPLLSLC